MPSVIGCNGLLHIIIAVYFDLLNRHAYVQNVVFQIYMHSFEEVDFSQSLSMVLN